MRRPTWSADQGVAGAHLDALDAKVVFVKRGCVGCAGDDLELVAADVAER